MAAAAAPNDSCSTMINTTTKMYAKRQPAVDLTAPMKPRMDVTVCVCVCQHVYMCMYVDLTALMKPRMDVCVCVCVSMPVCACMLI